MFVMSPNGKFFSPINSNVVISARGEVTTELSPGSSWLSVCITDVPVTVIQQASRYNK